MVDLLYKFMLFCFLVFLSVFIIFLIQYIYLRKQGITLAFKTSKKLKKIPLLKKLFVLFPRQFIIDRSNFNPLEFQEVGLHLFCGEQGSGKTLTAVYIIKQYLERYSKCKLYSNIQIQGQNGCIGKLTDVTKNKNGIYGEIDFFDEIQIEFNSLESKDFPPEMLTEICQQRKQHKAIFGTSQVFNRVSKQIREQVKYLYEPRTFFKCFTVCRIYKPLMDSSGSVTKKRIIKTFCFVHNKELRESYDTYEKVKKTIHKKYLPISERIH